MESVNIPRWRQATLHALARLPNCGDTCRLIRQVLPECLAVLGLLAMIWMSTAVLLWRERAHELEVARSMTDVLSKAFAETTARIVSELDQTLLSVRTSYAQTGQDFNIQSWAQRQIRKDQLRVQIAVMGKTGDVIRSTLAISNEGKINIADRPHFRYQLDPSRDDLYISDPVVGRGSRQQTIQFSRKLLDDNGDFAGVAVLSLSCAELSRFYGVAGTYEGLVTVANERGVVIGSGDPPSEMVGSTIAIPPIADPAADASAASSLSTVAWDTSNGQLISYRKLRRYPLTVVIAKTDAQIYERYWVTARHFVLVSLVASMIVVLLGVFWISQRGRAAASSRALAVTLAGVTQGIVMIDFRGRLSVINQRAQNLLRLPGQIPSGHDVNLAIDHLIGAAAPSPVEIAGQPASVAPGSPILQSLTEDGRAIELRITQLPDGGRVHTLTDITEQHKAQSRIHYLAHHDALTGLPNRLLLAEHITAALSHAATTGRMVMVMFLDLDGFKGVNDTLGHLLGDRLLKHVAAVIGQTIGRHDFVARLGGDEFTVVRADVEGVEAALQLAPLLITRIADPVIIEGHELRVSASVGVAVFPQDGLDYHALFRNADIALYRAKSEGRATYRIFEPGMDERLRLRMMLEEDLRAALDAGALQVHYQPQFESNSRHIVGFEALVRWEHPARGWVSPAIFVNVAEECGLINKLGAFVLQQACRDAVQWPSDCYVAVNVSAIQLLDVGFVSFVQDVLAKTGLPPTRLELELTESVMTDTGGQTACALAALRALGIRLALDDFGTGYSSLRNLLLLRFDKVKIDQSFIQEQHRDPNARAIVEAILAMSQHIGLIVTAEGVETEGQLTMLKSQGCPLIQGYLLGRPISGEKTQQLLIDRQKSRKELADLLL